MFLQSKNMFSIQNQSQKKRRELSILIDTNSPNGTETPFSKMKGWNSFPKNALSSM